MFVILDGFDMKSKRLLIWIVVLCMSLAVGASAVEELLVNPELCGDDFPQGWSVLSYLSSNYSVTVQDGEITMVSREPNDLRVFQTVKVKENTVYVLSAEVFAEGVVGGRGATLSIDNFSIDGCYIYSRNILGSVGWTKIELIFRTGKDQTEINAALRLGGYSEMSAGTVRFRSVSLREAGEGLGAVSLQGNNYPGENKTADDELTPARKIQLKSYLHLFIVIALFSAVIMLFGVYRSRERLGAAEISDINLRRYFLLAVLAGLILRTVLASAWGGHDSDMSCWMGWGSYIANNGPGTFYTAPGHEWYDYPPAYMLVLGLIARVLKILGIEADTSAAVFAYMLPAYLADVGSSWLVMRAAGKRGFSNSWKLFLGCICLFNPAIVMLSGAWGQIDSILTFFLLFSMEKLIEGKRISAGALFGLAIMIKWQALIYGPVLAAAYLLHLRTGRDIRDTVLGVLAAFAVIFLISLPFKGNQGALWIVDRFLNATVGYDYASVEAYNFLALCGGNWRNAGSPLIFGISYKTFGTAAILLAVGVSLLLQWREAKPVLTGEAQPETDNHMVFTASAFCMFTIYTFGHYMHERYVFPVILLLMMAFIYTRRDRLLLCSLALSAVVFLNEMTAMYVISRLASSVVRGGAEHAAVVRVCSAAECIVYAIFIHILHREVSHGKGEGAADNA